jgi:tripeptidyl-peptidase-1
MKLSGAAILGGLAAFVFAAPALNCYVVHEKPSVQNEKWFRRRDIKLNRDAVIPMSFGLTQRNVENGYDSLMDVSHPGSKNYGKHWPMSKVSGRYLLEKQLKLTKLDRGYFCSLN